MLKLACEGRFFLKVDESLFSLIFLLLFSTEVHAFVPLRPFGFTLDRTHSTQHQLQAQKNI